MKLRPGDEPEGQPLGDLFGAASRNPTPDRYRGGVLNSTHQCDLIELPLDDSKEAKRIVRRYQGGSYSGAKKMYALVVVDIATRTSAARALADKTANSTRNALIDIYNDNGPVGPLEYTLEPPDRMEMDGGSEFKASFSRYLRGVTTYIKVGRPGRSRQQALAENLNRYIGRVISIAQAKLMLEAEAAGQLEESRDWVPWLQDIMAAINDHLQRKPRPLQQTVGGIERLRPLCRLDRKKGSTTKQGSVNDCAVLDIGTRVRVKNDKPSTVTGERLSGSKRAGDPTFGPKIHTIVERFLTIGGPPRYVIEGLPQTSFTKNELRPV